MLTPYSPRHASTTIWGGGGRGVCVWGGGWVRSRTGLSGQTGSDRWDWVSCPSPPPWLTFSLCSALALGGGQIPAPTCCSSPLTKGLVGVQELLSIPGCSLLTCSSSPREQIDGSKQTSKQTNKQNKQQGGSEERYWKSKDIWLCSECFIEVLLPPPPPEKKKSHCLLLFSALISFCARTVFKISRSHSTREASTLSVSFFVIT